MYKIKSKVSFFIVCILFIMLFCSISFASSSGLDLYYNGVMLKTEKIEEIGAAPYLEVKINSKESFSQISYKIDGNAENIITKSKSNKYTFTLNLKDKQTMKLTILGKLTNGKVVQNEYTLLGREKLGLYYENKSLYTGVIKEIEENSTLEVKLFPKGYFNEISYEIKRNNGVSEGRIVIKPDPKTGKYLIPLSIKNGEQIQFVLHGNTDYNGTVQKEYILKCKVEEKIDVHYNGKILQTGRTEEIGAAPYLEVKITPEENFKEISYKIDGKEEVIAKSKNDRYIFSLDLKDKQTMKLVLIGKLTNGKVVEKEYALLGREKLGLYYENTLLYTGVTKEIVEDAVLEVRLFPEGYFNEISYEIIRSNEVSIGKFTVKPEPKTGKYLIKLPIKSSEQIQLVLYGGTAYSGTAKKEYILKGIGTETMDVYFNGTILKNGRTEEIGAAPYLEVKITPEENFKEISYKIDGKEEIIAKSKNDRYIFSLDLKDKQTMKLVLIGKLTNGKVVEKEYTLLGREKLGLYYENKVLNAGTTKAIDGNSTLEVKVFPEDYFNEISYEIKRSNGISDGKIVVKPDAKNGKYLIPLSLKYNEKIQFMLYGQMKDGGTMRKDYTLCDNCIIGVKEDSYVTYGDNTIQGKETKINIKSGTGKYLRYGYVKFDISELKDDKNISAIELNLTVNSIQKSSNLASVEVYGCETDWNENTLVYSNQPMRLGLVAELDNISQDKVTRNFFVTDYIKQALEHGFTEVAFCIVETTPEEALNIGFASKESKVNMPTLSVSHSKVDKTEYNGRVTTQPELSNNGIDNQLGFIKDTVKIISVSEDAYVEGGESTNKVFGKEDTFVVKGQAYKEDTSMNHRKAFLKFDISSLKINAKNKIQLQLYCNSIQNKVDKIPPLKLYSCDNNWSENKITYKKAPKPGKLIAIANMTDAGYVYVDITQYINEAINNKQTTISFYIDSTNDNYTAFRLNFDSKENKAGNPPALRVSDVTSANFVTYLEYSNENPWQVAMDSVTTWFARYENLKNKGTYAAERVVKDDSEYSVKVDVASLSDTNGAKTVYKQYLTRLLENVKGYKYNDSETELYDKYGGYMGDKKYKATGFFYTTKIDDRWVTIDPLGYPFYRVSCVAVDMGSALQRKQVLKIEGSKGKWVESTTARLRDLGFNSLGAWSDIVAFSEAKQPLTQTKMIGLIDKYTESLGTERADGNGSQAIMGGVIPAFDPEFKEFAYERTKNEVKEYAKDSNIYGWMSDNELPDGTNMLRNALNCDYTDSRFIYTYATAWTFMYLRTGKKDVSINDVTVELEKEFRAMVYDKYFEVTKGALDKYAPNHQYMGCRFLPGCYTDELVLRVSGQWCDIISLNYYGAWNPDITVIYNLERYSGKPFIVTEFYAKGMDVWEKDNRMTNKSGAGWTVRTQEDRGKFYQTFTLMLLECKGCVGFDWFKYWDDDPDNTEIDISNRKTNRGIISTNYLEYTDLTKYMEKVNKNKYSLIKFFDER